MCVETLLWLLANWTYFENNMSRHKLDRGACPRVRMSFKVVLLSWLVNREAIAERTEQRPQGTLHHRTSPVARNIRRLANCLSTFLLQRASI